MGAQRWDLQRGVDHTKATPNGVFAMYDPNNQAGTLNYNAQLKSEPFEATNGRCLSFWYYFQPCTDKKSTLGLKVSLLSSVNLKTAAPGTIFFTG